MIASTTALISLLPLLLQSTLVTAHTLPTAYPSLDTDMSTTFSFNGQTSQSDFQIIIAFYKADPRMASRTISECIDPPKSPLDLLFPKGRWGLRSIYRYGCFLYALNANPDPERHSECRTNINSLACVAKVNSFWNTMNIISPSNFRDAARRFLDSTFLDTLIAGFFNFAAQVGNLAREKLNIFIPLNDFEVIAYSAIVIPMTKWYKPTSFMSMIYYVNMGYLKVSALDNNQIMSYLSASVAGVVRPEYRNQKRQQSTTVDSTTQIMLQYCNLNAINNNNENNGNILVRCLGGIARWCNTGSKDLKAPGGCHDYYNRVYGNSMYAPLVKSCPMWIKGPKSLECNIAVNDVCNRKGLKSVECSFSQFSQSQLFTNRTLAPW